MRYPEHLTKEKAIELHRQLWNYIADESERTGKVTSKEDTFEHFEWKGDVIAHCWCCEYANRSCMNCPIAWPRGMSCTIGLDSVYIRWVNAAQMCYTYEDGNEKVKYKQWLNVYIKCAREIANLPERKE